MTSQFQQPRAMADILGAADAGLRSPLVAKSALWSRDSRMLTLQH